MTHSEAIQATRDHFIAIAEECIECAETGKFFVNDKARYIAKQKQYITDLLGGAYSNSFTFRQYQHYLETGESVGLLPK